MQVSQPNKLKTYRYLKREEAHRMVRDGEVRVGTLLYYRTIEDAARRDTKELKKSVFHKFNEQTVIKTPKEWKEKVPSRKGLDISYQSGNIVIPQDFRFVETQDLPDTYVVCTSKKYDENLKRKFNSDSCVEIFDVKNFLRIVSLELEKLGLIYPAISGSAGDVHYIGHEFDKDVGTSANWLKDYESFHDEEEFRFCFIPVFKREGRVIEPIMWLGGRYEFPSNHDPITLTEQIVRNKEIVNCCRLLEV